MTIALPITAEQPVAPSQAQVSPLEQHAQCGPECKCGCLQGGPCHCHDKAAPQNTPPTQQSHDLSFPESTTNAQLAYNDHDYSGYAYQSGYDAYQYGYNPYQTGYDASQTGYCADSSACYGDNCGCYSEADRCFIRTYAYTDCYGERRPTNIDPWDITYEPCSSCGVWLPDDPILFRPFMADPREICLSAGWRFNDNALTKNNIPVSYFDLLGIYRWCHVGPWDGNLQISLEGALWAVFDPCTFSAPLINADYYVGVPITYAYDRWQFRLRGFHISSHIGDEFLLNHPGFNRKNPSAEYFDFFISHDLTEEIRLYAGVGYTLWQDESWYVDPFYAAIGAELRLLRWGFLDVHDRLYGCPIFAMHFRGNGEFRKHIDQTYILGYEFGKLCGLFHKLRFFIEYHDGYSVEGQFAKTPTNYFSVCATYGF